MTWPISTIGEVCVVVSGATPRTSNPDFWDGDIPWVTPKDLSELRHKHLSDTSRRITEAGLQSCSARMLPAQSVLLSSRAPIGLVAMNTLPVCTNQGFKSLVPRDGCITPDYLYWWLKIHREAVEYRGRGATFKEVSKKIVEEIPIPLPPIADQKRIAAILDAADALRAKRRETLAQLDTLLQSTFLDMFGDPVANPMGWERRPIDSVFEVARGGSPRPIRSYLTESEDGLNWIMIGDAVEGSRYITSTNRRIRPEGLRKSRKVHEGDLLLTNSMSFGKPYLLKVEGCIHDGWLVLSPKDKRMSADFFHSLLGTEALYREFKKKAAGAVVKNLNTKLVGQVSVPVPPLDLQHRYAAIVESAEQQKACQHAHLAELDALFASLQSRAFKGDL